jgi:hypothetical protein
VGLFRRPISRQRFAAEAVTVVGAHPRVERAWLDDALFAVRYVAGGMVSTFFLDNVYREAAAASRTRRRRRIAELIDAVVDAPTLPDWPEVRPLLRPVLRGNTFGLHPPYDTDARLYRPALPYLSEFVVVDLPTSMAYLTTTRLSEWGVEPDEVFAAARANMADAAARVAAAIRPGQVLRFVDDGDSYFASCLVMDDFLAEVARRFDTPVAAFVPDTTTLMIMPAEPAGLLRMLDLMGHEYATAARSLSPMAYTVGASGTVVPYRAQEPGELADAVHRAGLRLAVDEYGAQRASLQALVARDGVDMFVSDLLVAARPSGSLFSVALWPQDCPALLPEADFVGFVDETTPLTVPWPIVRAETGLTPVPGLVPPRFQVTQAPPEPVLERLRAEAVNP